MEMNLVAIWHGMNNLVRAVVIVLTLQALGCIYVAIDRLFLLAVVLRSRAEVRPPRRSAAGRRATTRARSTLAKQNRGSHLAGFILTGVETFDKQRGNGLRRVQGRRAGRPRARAQGRDAAAATSTAA